MNPTPDTTTAGNGGNFDPRQAAALLDQTTERTRRKLEPSPPWLLATRAVLVLATCGAVWLSVRGQHPYKGPTAAVIPVLVAFIVINFVATVGVRRRHTTGVRGPSRLRPAEIAILAAAWAAVVVVMVALAAAGVNFSLYPTTVLILPGLAWAAVNAARANWRSFGTGAGVVAVGIVGAFAGPVGAWAVAGVGLCLVLLGTAAAIAWQRRA
ncbi:MAG TPA: hypothetical protein VHT94_14020 [Streptosporangiaceae bacterium]|jgi:hypothetical protein|nr:hypothetical protein [Streptosporangiaceae bacterium]